MNAFALASSDPGININAVGDAMERRGETITGVLTLYT